MAQYGIAADVPINDAFDLVLGPTHGGGDLTNGQVGQPPRYREYMTDILGSGRKLLDMVTDILDFTRIEGNLVAMNDSVLSLPDILRETAELVRPEWSGQLAIAESVIGLPMLRADETCVRRALAHLLRNAVEYTKPGETVCISAELKLENRIAISVTGIPVLHPETGDLSERLADRRLCLANAYVKLHDGEILVERTQGGNPRIALLFPSARTEFHDGQTGLSGNLDCKPHASQMAA